MIHIIHGDISTCADITIPIRGSIIQIPIENTGIRRIIPITAQMSC
jgi:hypothetical protein